MGIDEFKELQKLFAQQDILTELRQSPYDGSMEILLVKRKNMKIKMYQERGHSLPHLHIDYGKKHHVASYSIDTAERIEGDLPKMYDCNVVDWINRNRVKLLEIWSSLQAGITHEHLLAELPGDI